MPTRRSFVSGSVLALAGRSVLFAQGPTPAPTTRPNLAVVDHDRIVAAATLALADGAAPNPESTPAALLAFSLHIPALASATLVDPGNAGRYNAAALTQLQAWFVAPASRLPCKPTPKSSESLIDFCQLAEVAMAVPLLDLEASQLAAIKRWFAESLTFLLEDRTALLARDARNHHASSWLLQAAAFAHVTANEAVTDELRHRFKTTTIRAQIDAQGLFPHELTTEDPFRNSLFNLDLLAGVANLLSTRFESVWDHELQDGPGMRSAVARHAVYMRNRAKWPYPADASHFNLLPYRRPALVFAARAYAEPEYVALWRTLNPDPTDPELLRSFPIRQPILWLPQTRQQTPDPKVQG